MEDNKTFKEKLSVLNSDFEKKITENLDNLAVLDEQRK